MTEEFLAKKIDLLKKISVLTKAGVTNAAASSAVEKFFLKRLESRVPLSGDKGSQTKKNRICLAIPEGD